MPRRLRPGAPGFTLLEMLLALAIGSVVIVASYMVYEAGSSTLQRNERKADLQQNARAALDVLTWQIRHAGYLNLGTVSNRIAIGTNTVLVLRGDVQLNGTPTLADTLFGVQAAASAACPAPPCLVTGTNVYTVAAAQAVTAFNVSSVTFQYFDQNNLPLAAPLDGVGEGAFPNGIAAANPLPGTVTARDAVRRIRVTLTATNPTVSAGPGAGSVPETVTLTADVRVRNIS